MNDISKIEDADGPVFYVSLPKNPSIIEDVASSRHVQLNTAAVGAGAVLATAQQFFPVLAPVVSPEVYGYGFFALAIANTLVSLRSKARKKRQLLRQSKL